MRTSEARLKAQRKYDKEHASEYRSYNLKYNRHADAEVIQKLDKVSNKHEYLRRLILADIRKNGL